MRRRTIGELGDPAHTRFLVYLMGPYRAFDVEATLETTARDPATVPETVDFSGLVGSNVTVGRDEAVLDLLLTVRDRLRTDPGVNAFLAIDETAEASRPTLTSRRVSTGAPRTPPR